MKEVYLDYAATTPVDPRVADVMNACLRLDGNFANPSSSHQYGKEAHAIIEKARKEVARKIISDPNRIYFTSGATESNNIAIKGIVKKGDHIITSLTEHKAVLDTVNFLEKNGIDVTYLKCDSKGIIDPLEVKKHIKNSTRLVSIMHVNNEIGVEQDIREIAKHCNESEVLFHVDAAQSAGKVLLNLKDWNIDLASITAHKCYGPKGIGAIYVKEGIRVNGLFHGGDQEHGLRPGTLPTHQIAGMGKAYELLNVKEESKRLKKIKNKLWEGLNKISEIRLNGDLEKSSPHVLNITFLGVEGESLRLAISDIAISAGSACNSESTESSHVLSILGLSETLANSSIRFSFGRFTKFSEIDYVVERIKFEVNRLRSIMGKTPKWCRS